MKNSLDYFRSEEQVRIGNTTIKIEHSSLENLVGFASIIVVAGITSPIWISHGLYSLGKAGYKRLAKKAK